MDRPDVKDDGQDCQETESEKLKLLNENVNCLQKFDTLLNADAAEFCPFPNLQNILLCGTYKLEEASSCFEPSSDSEKLDEIKSTPAPQKRLGGVKVFHLGCHENEGLSLQEVNCLDLCGVLDIKWPHKPPSDQTVFGLVDAEGYLQILKLGTDLKSVDVLAKEKLSESSLGLSLEWSLCDQGNSSLISCSDSTGCVTIYDFREGLNISSRWKAHEYEAWITAFDQFNSNIVYSGGDDCLLKTWDCRDTSRPALVSRSHQMGVCSVQSNPLDENIFATGSYDEQLFIWDRRNPKRPIAETCLGGGVWRIKWEPHQAKHILTATMYNGTHIIGCEDLGKSPLPILANYSDHNLAYGADWCRLSKQSFLRCNETEIVSNTDTEDVITNAKSYIISTCSFYDHSLHLWEWNS